MYLYDVGNLVNQIDTWLTSNSSIGEQEKFEFRLKLANVLCLEEVVAKLENLKGPLQSIAVELSSLNTALSAIQGTGVKLTIGSKPGGSG